MPTLLETFKSSESTRERAVLKTITERSALMERVPFKEINSGTYTYDIEQSLPGVAARNIGGSYTASSGVKTRISESLCIIGGEVVIDNYEVNLNGGGKDVKLEQYAMKARAMALTFSEWFFEGDGDLNPAQFNGLRKRLAGTNQVVNLASGGATLTLSALDQLYDTVVGGPDAFFMNKTMARKIMQLARDVSGHALLDTNTSALGKRVTEYNGVPILIVERDDNASTILDFDEDDGIGNLDTASIYAVKFGDSYVGALRGKGSSLTVKDFGEQEAAPRHMGRIEAYWGMYMKHPRSAARLTRINNA